MLLLHPYRNGHQCETLTASCSFDSAARAGQFWTNPQFRVTQDHTGPVNAVISLLEVTDRFLRSVDDVNIGFVIFKVS